MMAEVLWVDCIGFSVVPLLPVIMLLPVSCRLDFFASVVDMIDNCYFNL